MKYCTVNSHTLLQACNVYFVFVFFPLSLSFSASGKYAALGNGISKMCNEFDNYATENFSDTHSTRSS